MPRTRSGCLSLRVIRIYSRTLPAPSIYLLTWVATTLCLQILGHLFRPRRSGAMRVFILILRAVYPMLLRVPALLYASPASTFLRCVRLIVAIAVTCRVHVRLVLALAWSAVSLRPLCTTSFPVNQRAAVIALVCIFQIILIAFSFSCEYLSYCAATSCLIFVLGAGAELRAMQKQIKIFVSDILAGASFHDHSSAVT